MKLLELTLKADNDKAPEGSEPYLEIGDIDIETKNYSLKAKKSVSGAVKAKKGTIAVSTVRPDRGAITILKNDMAVSNAFALLNIDEAKADTDYVFFALMDKKFLDYLAANSKGATYPTCSKKDVLNYEIKMPSISKQKAIAQELRKIERFIYPCSARIEFYNELVKSRFIEMFGDPDISPKYASQKLGKLGSLDRGVSKARPRNEPSLIGGPYPLVQTGDVASSGLFIKKYSSTYSEKGLAQSKMWRKGTLLITIAANIAETGILGFDACFPDSLVGFDPGHLISNVYLHYWFEFEKKQISERTVCVAQKNLNLASLKNFDIELPPIEEQKRFESFALQIDKLKLDVQKEIDLAEELLALKFHQYFEQEA
jgi:type I restriction enzyme, S subunit